MKTLNDLFEDMLQDVYFAEKTLVKALPKMAKKATSENFKTALTDHLAQTQEHVTRLESIFDMLGEKPKAKQCPAILGLVKEAEEIMDEAQDDAVRDAGMVACAQAVEHYEIARYGSLCAWARQLGMKQAEKMLTATLDEEINADTSLMDLALEEINDAAPVEDDGGQEDDKKASGEKEMSEQTSRKTRKPSAARA